jgi:hypothetical protein
MTVRVVNVVRVVRMVRIQATSHALLGSMKERDKSVLLSEGLCMKLEQH